MPNKILKSNRAKPPAAGRGRPAGSPNRTTAALKEAILLAAEAHGSDGRGKDGINGYLRHLATADTKAYTGLLSKLLPTNVKAEIDMPVRYVARVPEKAASSEDWIAQVQRERRLRDEAERLK